MNAKPVTARSAAAANQAIIAAGCYRAPGGAAVALGAQVAEACQGTVSYTPEQTAGLLEAWRAPDGARRAATAIEVTAESSMNAARRLAGPDDGTEALGPLAVLNFASARNPGGGYLGGARAQEEDLCRVSALYTTLLRAPDYYAAHRASRDVFYSHRVIVSPRVPVFRDEHYALLERPYQVSFLTSPAPNAGAAERDRRDRIPALLAERAARVLAVAAHHGQRRLVLGAWGCGVFRNDPTVVACAFRDLLTGAGRFAGAFEHVVFAVLDRGAGRANLAAFRAAFAQQAADA
ncbi:MAG TPA: TIGR02452 family protein [Actinocrinis sp.]|jgi:uncharacterized protein (TIGR02452 family)